MSSNPARSFFETCLREAIAYNSANRIAPSETAVATRLLTRGLELHGFYQAVYDALPHDLTRRTFLTCCVLDIGVCWTEADGKQAREDKKRLEELNATIAKLSNDLADLLEQRTAINERGAFSSNHVYHIKDVMDGGTRGNGFYQSHLRQPLDELRSRFDLKYWPKLNDILREIGRDAEQAEVRANDPLTAAMCQSTRPSKADVVRAIQASIEDNKHGGMNCLPRSFKLSDDALASLANVLLDLPADKTVDAKYVKNIRDRDAERLMA